VTEPALDLAHLGGPKAKKKFEEVPISKKKITLNFFFLSFWGDHGPSIQSLGSMVFMINLLSDNVVVHITLITSISKQLNCTFQILLLSFSPLRILVHAFVKKL
jgi:hypothetical protein